MSCIRCGVPLKNIPSEIGEHCYFCSRKLKLEYFSTHEAKPFNNWFDPSAAELLLANNFNMSNYEALKDRMVRAGDVLLYPIDAIPDLAYPTNDTILALGEKSGHKHLMRGQLQVFETRDPMEMETVSLRKVLARKFLQILEPSLLVHENKQGKQADHKAREVKPGAYMVLREKELNPFEEMVKQVED